LLSGSPVRVYNQPNSDTITEKAYFFKVFGLPIRNHASFLRLPCRLIARFKRAVYYYFWPAPNYYLFLQAVPGLARVSPFDRLRVQREFIKPFIIE